MSSIIDEIKEEGKDILASEHHKATRYDIQHGNISVRQHTIRVAQCSVQICNRLKLPCDRRAMIRGALLHDFFLYDWHDKEHVKISHLHGIYHPGIALQNAEAEFELSDIERDIIKKHMWPLTIVPPVCREAWVVTIADKYCSLMETIWICRKR